MGIVIVTGGIDSGKTTWCLKNLVEGKMQVDGVLSLKVYRRNERIGYDVLRVKTGERVPLARLKENVSSEYKGQLELGIFLFYREAFRWAEKWFQYVGPLKSFIIDELGPLELRREGFYNLACSILGKRNEIENIYLVVRKSLVESVILNFNINDYSLIDVDRS